MPPVGGENLDTDHLRARMALGVVLVVVGGFAAAADLLQGPHDAEVLFGLLGVVLLGALVAAHARSSLERISAYRRWCNDPAAPAEHTR